jgi:uracil phosphoribosyltransferase
MTGDPIDQAYRSVPYALSEMTHRYGPRVHILANPLALSLLARLGSPDTAHPAINAYLKMLYQTLVDTVINAEFPRRRVRVTSRMAVHTPRGVFETEMVDPDVKVVTVDIARAGILPSQIAFERLNHVLNPAGVRQDHLLMSRSLNQAQEVTGAGVGGCKIGGPIGGHVVLFPDPMGATGASLSTAIDLYKQGGYGDAWKIITLQLIVTPEFIRTMLARHPEVVIYAWRLDRGLSGPEVLATVPGTRWDEERGLNEHQYIVPGAGGLGEILNNAFV